ncbi:MAG TPA: PPOX class F420-dependent oxidoreductase [Candidatus Acidoferrum sp.]|jgi:PPOX class probable F420-dependent enzyme|nr:PPOX class F420-dependent oxidoreductase [Candidatus Acidoferrum sp.]
MGFEVFRGQKYLSLETFRKSGEGVKTPVWFAADPRSDLSSGAAKLYAYTIGNSGKVKRMRNNPRVRVAPCDIRGNVTGPWLEGRAEILNGSEALYGDQLLNQKYFPWKQLLNFFASFRRRGRTGFVIRPV